LPQARMNPKVLNQSVSLFGSSCDIDSLDQHV
jgi:hypothetical protein